MLNEVDFKIVPFKGDKNLNVTPLYSTVHTCYIALMESFEFNDTFFSLLKGQIRGRAHSSANMIPVCLLFIYNIAISKRAWQLNIVTLSHANFRFK